MRHLRFPAAARRRSQRKLGPEASLLGIGPLEARPELGILPGLTGVALDSALGLEAEIPLPARGRSDSCGRERPPSAWNGACSVTAGKPYAQRAATGRNGRAGRPSCQEMTRVVHQIMAPPPSEVPTPFTMKRRPPLADEPEAPCLPDDVVARSRVHELLGQVGVAAFELVDGRSFSPKYLLPRVAVRGQRVDVGQSDRDEETRPGSSGGRVSSAKACGEPWTAEIRLGPRSFLLSPRPFRDRGQWWCPARSPRRR